MEFTNESDWLNCNDDPTALARHCRGLVDVQRFRWLAVQLGNHLKELLTPLEQQRFESYKAWVNGHPDDPINLEPISEEVVPDQQFQIVSHLIRQGSLTRLPFAPMYSDSSAAYAAWYIRNVRIDPMLAVSAAVKAASRIIPIERTLELSLWGVMRTTRGVIYFDNEHDLREKHRLLVCREFCDQFRDVSGNPFRPVALNRRWLTDSVVQLAKTIDETGRYELMPILADALQEADCNSEELLAHCREGKVHVRGCWAIDLLLTFQ